MSRSVGGPEDGKTSAHRERLAKIFLGAAWLLLAMAALLTLPHLVPWLAGALRRNPEAALMAGGLLCLIVALRFRSAVSAQKEQ